MRWILVLAILVAATPPLIAILYLRRLSAASKKASAAGVEIRRKLLRMIVR